MPRDIVLTTTVKPNLTDLVRVAADTDPGLRVREIAHGAVTQFVDDDGNVVLSISIDSAVLVAVPGESARLIGAAAPEPVWWIEAWTSFGPAGERGIRLAREFAQQCRAACRVTAMR